MKRLIVGMLLVVCAAGCKRSPSTPVVPPPGGTEVALPADPILPAMEGRWGRNGRTVLTVMLKPDGTGVLNVADVGEGWRAEVSNVRIEKSKILYDQYNYATDVASHPFNGVRCRVVFELIPAMQDQARLRMSADAEEVKPGSELLVRMK